MNTLTDGEPERMYLVVDAVTVIPDRPGQRLTLQVETQEGVTLYLYFPRHSQDSLQDAFKNLRLGS